MNRDDGDHTRATTSRMGRFFGKGMVTELSTPVDKPVDNHYKRKG